MRFWLILAVCAALFSGGCRNRPSIDGNAGFKTGFQRDISGRSVEGREIESYVFGTGSDTIMYLATIHGNENAGTPLMEKFIEGLKNDKFCLNGKRVVVVPVVNPDGFAADTRYNANGIDLNRNFSAANRENSKINGLWAFSEPESRTLATLIDIYRPGSIVVFHEPLNCIDYDGPGQELTEAMGKKCDLPVKKLGARAGSLGAYAGETLGIKTITVEFSNKVKGKSGDYMWANYGDMVLAALEY